MPKSDLRQFNYSKVAKLDTNMWRSYYNHQFLKMFFQLLRLMRTQLHMNWLIIFRLAYHAGVAATQYRLKRGNEDYNKALKHLTKFYELISKNCIEPFDYKKAGELELEWWDIHRYPEKYKKSLEQSLAQALAVVYSVDPKSLKDYAHYRKVAMLLPNHQGDSQLNPPSWQKIEDLLIKSWRSAHRAVQK